MVKYKWVALSNTSLGTLLSSINLNITLISLPAIFRGIGIDPLAPDSFAYLLWTLMGYNLVTATLLVTFGKLSDMYGRVKLYNLGFVIFTLGSIMLSLIYGQGDIAGIQLIAYRLIQAVGGAFLFTNSVAILTDAFPPNERGKALGINQLTFLVGNILGLILGGILSAIDWRWVFLVNVPIGIVGTIWSYLSLREIITPVKQRIDILGNAIFVIGLTLILVGMTYGLMPYESDSMGWNNPYVIASLAIGGAFMVAFPFVEMKQKEPMFNLRLFKIRDFAAGNLANFLSSIARGGVTFMLIILLQGIWLPLHGYKFEDTPFWAGIYMIPFIIGFSIAGPISGILADKHGPRYFTVSGMFLTGICFIWLAHLPYNFSYEEFAVIIFLMGIGNGLFGSPINASIMSSVPKEDRGSASGMRATMMNIAQTISMTLFFTIVITALSSQLPQQLYDMIIKAGGSQQLATLVESIPPTSAIFAAFLGYNPIGMMFNDMPNNLKTQIDPNTLSILNNSSWFSSAIAPPFMSALAFSFYIGAVLSFIAAIAASFSEKSYVRKANQI
ncbi:MAG TPA: MFS transporter [Geobacterales bacterium]|nr:MFS transporter [Geobacterales bacterium]